MISVISILLMVLGTATSSSSVQQQHCGFVYTARGAVWSPDCQAYFVNERGTRTTADRHPVVTGRFGVATVRVIRLRDGLPLITEPTERVRQDIIRQTPPCVDLRIDVVGLKWFDSKQLLVDAKLYVQ